MIIAARRATVALCAAACLSCTPVVSASDQIDFSVPTEKQAAKLQNEPKDSRSAKIRDVIRACEAIAATLDTSDPVVRRVLPRLRQKLGWLYEEYNAVDGRDYSAPNHSIDKALQWIAEYDLKRALSLLAQKKDPGSVRRGKQPSGALLEIDRRERFLASWDLHIPSGYDREKKWPLIICFQTSMNAKQVGEAGYFLCQSFQRGMPRSSIHLGHLMVAMIRETAADYSIDLDRVYLTGFSTGGATSFVYAYRFSDLIAAVAPVCPAAEWRDGGTRHAHNVATLVMYGTGDGWTRKGAEPIIKRLKKSGHPNWEEYPFDAGHTSKPVLVDDTSRILEFFSKHRRDPHPKKVWKWVEHKRWSSAYWLMVKLRKDGKCQGGVVAEVKPGNVVDISSTEDIAAVALYLDEHLVDANAPVKVVANGVPRYEGPVKPELYVEILDDHEPYWQDRVITGLNPYWVRGRAWPRPKETLERPAWLAATP